MSDELSPVLVDPNALAPERIRYPHNHVCNVLAEQAAMMDAAAALLDFKIHYGEPTRPGFLGVYVSDLERDPADLPRLFEAFKIAYWKWSKYRETFKPAGTRAAHPDPTDPRD